MLGAFTAPLRGLPGCSGSSSGRAPRPSAVPAPRIAAQQAAAARVVAGAGPRFNRELLLDNVDDPGGTAGAPGDWRAAPPPEPGLGSSGTVDGSAYGAQFPDEQPYAAAGWSYSEAELEAGRNGGGPALTPVASPSAGAELPAQQPYLPEQDRGKAPAYSYNGQVQPWAAGERGGRRRAAWAGGHGEEDRPASSPPGPGSQNYYRERGLSDWGEQEPLTDWGEARQRPPGALDSGDESPGWGTDNNDAGGPGPGPSSGLYERDFVADGGAHGEAGPDGSSGQQEPPYELRPSDIVLLSRPEAVRYATPLRCVRL